MSLLIRVATVIGILAALWALLVFSQWLPLRSAEENEALSIIDRTHAQQLGERNAFPRLWLFDYDLNEQQVASVMAQDAARLAALPLSDESEPSFVSGAEGRYPKLATPSEQAWHCTVVSVGCLSAIRAHLNQVREELDMHRVRLLRLESLADFDHAKVLFVHNLSTPYVHDFRPGRLLLSAAAVEHLDGDSITAVQRLCRATAGWRRLASKNNSLIVSALTQVAIAETARMLAEILAERPDLDALACLSAFSPLNDDDFNQCPIMAAEYQIFANIMGDVVRKQAAERWPRNLASRALNLDHILARHAVATAFFCQDVHRQRVHKRSQTPQPPAAYCGVLSKIFDPIGCTIIKDMGAPYDRFYLRSLDTDAQLRLLQSARWLRASADERSVGERLAELPAELRSPEHSISYDASSGEIRIKLLDDLHSEYWSVPISTPRRPDIAAAKLTPPSA